MLINKNEYMIINRDILTQRKLQSSEKEQVAGAAFKNLDKFRKQNVEEKSEYMCNM